MNIRAAVQNTLAVIRATVPPTAYDNTREFVVVDDETRAAAALTRRCHWRLTGEIAWNGDMSQQAEAHGMQLGLDVVITYARGVDRNELLLVIAEDVVALKQALANPGSYDSNTTSIWTRDAGPFELDEDSIDGGVDEVTLSITLTFDPES